MKKSVIYLGLALFSASVTFNSCMQENDSPITEPTRYTSNDIKSYADLFKVFWTVMDQRYNYFYEQKGKDGMDWNAIYKEYYPKFAALKSYNGGVSDAEFQADAEKARVYFTEIINPIIDRHFYVKIKVPFSNSGITNTYTFYGGMNEARSNTYPFDAKYGYMKDRLQDGAVLANNFLLAGNLKSNPDIYYFSFKSFSLSTNFKITLLDKYLSPDPGNSLVLTPAAIESSTQLNAISDVNKRNEVKNFTINILNEWNSFPNSNEMKSFNSQIGTFKSTEVLSDAFLSVTQQLLTKSNNLVKYNSTATYSSVLSSETLAYIQWFIQQMDNHVKYGYNLGQFQSAANKILTNASFYQKFLNPLHKGDIKKVIIDLRGNGGGNIVDARFFTDRFITKSALAFYQRTKEGNGQFNYTPWVPVQVNPHMFGIPGNIPIVVLTDKGSASMSEMSTLMLKSQGTHAISMGDYSAGATAGLGGSDDFNGGTRDAIAGGILEFYMPLMATKNLNNEVIEGIGVKPDIYVTPPSNAEVAQMTNSPKTFADRVMEEAIKYLLTK
ncbi:S41 family peptidase [Chryseobacterium jejuense]|uniref:C-terminal processing peptidase n=1 Tax=Chryseobacterium jejuense TaxID=445960 RepID=A0A2X2XNB2_CHRJE|nr:S41 family peptidase [Chryseobacterium jejuense]SDI93895.1 Peptidase family S41 [Chryseobacterium jejuense]SQB27249.1 C-terminal processing peptidase [Chryseobacterium jejuense]